jgi:putative hydrolase of the HAD superfamily
MEPDEVWAQVHDEGSWRHYEVGAISTDEYARIVGKLLNIELAAEDFIQAWCAATFPGLCHGIEDLYDEVAATGLRVMALSNTNEAHLEFLRRQFPIMQRFQPLYASHEIRARKPDRAAFNHVLQDTGLDARGCIFVDDRPENLVTARSVGMHTILAEGTESVRQGLRRLGII